MSSRQVFKFLQTGILLMIVYLVRRRVFARILISVFWLILGITNGYMLMKRVTPFNAQDLKVLSDAISLTGNYFGKMDILPLESAKFSDKQTFQKDLFIFISKARMTWQQR